MSNSAFKWALVRIKDVAAINPATFFVDETVPFLPMSDISTKGFDVKEYKLSAEASKYSQAQKNDVLFAKVTPCFENGKGCVIDISKAILATTEVTVLRAGKTVMPLYLRLITQSIDFKQYGVNNMKGANGLKRVTEKASGNYSFLLPSLLEQKKILNYLSECITAIDSKIQLLQEKSTALSDLRKSVIHQAVTKGLDLNVVMKPSGVNWIGDIPAHWTHSRVKSLVSITKGKKPELFPELKQSRKPYLSARVVRGLEKPQYAESSDSQSVHATKNDILMIMDGSNSGEIFTGVDGIVSSTMGCLHHNSHITKRTLMYWLDVLFETFNSETVGAAIPHLNKDAFNKASIALPFIGEQIAIATYLDARTSVIDDSIKTITEQITALKSLRQSLIHEAVTGKINVADFCYKTT